MKTYWSTVCTMPMRCWRSRCTSSGMASACNGYAVQQPAESLSESGQLATPGSVALHLQQDLCKVPHSARHCTYLVHGCWVHRLALLCQQAQAAQLKPHHVNDNERPWMAVAVTMQALIATINWNDKLSGCAHA